MAAEYDEGPDEPMQYEEEEDLSTGHQQHTEVFLQEVVGEVPPALAHRNPFGLLHTAAECSQVEAELELATAAAHAIDDSDMEVEAEQAQAASTGATEIIQEAKKAAERAEEMPLTLGGFTDPLPTDVAPLPPPFLSHG